MVIPRDTSVTAETASGASARAWASEIASGPAGVWTLDGAALVAADADGPATMLVPSEGVRLVAVDLPLPTRAKRLAALPYAVEDLIAEGIDSVHLALGAEVAPRRFLVGIVRHDRMLEWVARAEDAGLDHAALVPDALALPVPGEGEWAVELGETRALVRAGDGTGFAVPAPMLRTAWDAAGQPRTIAYGTALPAEMTGDADAIPLDALGRRLLAPALDLRQGPYARRRRSLPSFGKRLAKIVAIGVLAHAVIATADTIALMGIADKRADETRELVASLSPGTALPSEGLATAVADLLPPPGTGGGANAFLPAVTRLSSALAPLGPDVAASAMMMAGDSLSVDLASTDPALGGRVRTALADAGLAGSVAPTATGVRVTVRAA